MNPDAVPEWEIAQHARIDPHHKGTLMSDVILGAQDGIVNILGVVLGVSAASGSARLAIAAALAAAFAESISMAGVAYTSSMAAGDVYRSERAREYRHVSAVPTLEREEIRALYARKGFEGELLDRVVETITSNPDVWVAVMMSEEHGLVPIARRRALRSGAVVGISAITGSLLPIVPFAFLGFDVAQGAAVVVAAATLFAIGANKARKTIGHPCKAGLEIAAIGLISALAGWGIGLLFRNAG
ncbi:MAG: VIT1/CCC1 transporter family protein [Polyangiaceae bacterium]|jgi:VIT1/CCC1 family predicted Fe2+/Mn2+ transporter